MKRTKGESDDAYFMRVYQWARVKYSNLTKVELFLGTCIETRLPCLHPISVRVHQCSSGEELAIKYLEGESPNALECKDYRKRFNQQTFCPVCHTWGPVEPVDICANREHRLVAVLNELGESHELEG